MNFYLFEDRGALDLMPLTTTRAVYDLRRACSSILDYHNRQSPYSLTGVHARPELAAVTRLEHPDLVVNEATQEPTLLLNGRVLTTPPHLWKTIQKTVQTKATPHVFIQGEEMVGAWSPHGLSVNLSTPYVDRSSFPDAKEVPVNGACFVNHLWDLMTDIPDRIADAVRNNHLGELIGPPTDTHYRSEHVTVSGIDNIHCHPTATICPGATINATEGPVIIDEHAEIMEGVVARGPLYVGPHTQLRIHAQVLHAAIGPHCKIGGEVHDAVIHGFSNKAHYGFLGHSIVGSWCNLGAGTSNSNLRNDFGTVTVYNQHRDAFQDTGRRKVGLFVGDHCKTAINTIFNTGTVAGVCCNIFGSDFPPRFIRDFSWGRTGNWEPFRIDEALGIARRMAQDIPTATFTEADANLLRQVFENRHGTTRTPNQDE